MDRFPACPAHAIPLLATAPLLISACTDAAPPPGPAWEARDSLGVRIVETHEPVLSDPLPWRVGSDPVFTVGELEGPEHEVFDQVGSVLRLPDGRIAVADGGAREIRVFHPDGTFSKRWGGPGEGPGEFGSLRWVARDPGSGGRLLAYDGAANRVLRLDLEGEEVDRIQVEPFQVDLVPPELDRGGRLGGRHSPVGVFADGSFLSEVFESWLPEEMGNGPEGWPLEPLTLHVDAAGEVAGFVGRFFRQETILEPGGRTMARPLGPRGEYRPYGDRVLHGDGRDFALRLHDRDGGDVVEVWRRRWSPVPVTEEVRREVRERDLATAAEREGDPDGEAVRTRQRLLDRTTWPERFPAFDAILADTDGHVWVREVPGLEAEGGSDPEDRSPDRWSVFDPDGRWLGSLDLPAGFEPREIGRDYLLGIREDELGVQQVRMYPLERGSGG